MWSIFGFHGMLSTIVIIAMTWYFDFTRGAIIWCRSSTKLVFLGLCFTFQCKIQYLENWVSVNLWHPLFPNQDPPLDKYDALIWPKQDHRALLSTTRHMPRATFTCRLQTLPCQFQPVTWHLPTATSHLPPATCQLPTTTCHLPPFTCYLPKTWFDLWFILRFRFRLTHISSSKLFEWYKK